MSDTKLEGEVSEQMKILRLEGTYSGVRFRSAAIPETVTAEEVFERIRDHSPEEPVGTRGRLRVESATGGAANLLEAGAGADGGVGYFAHVELYDDAVRIADWWNGWQPIETAPKDELVLLALPGVKRAQVGSQTPEGRWWRSGAMLSQPTHWMPLPEPPISQPLDGGRP